MKRPGIMSTPAQQASSRATDMRYEKSEFPDFSSTGKRAFATASIDDLLGQALAQVDLRPALVPAEPTQGPSKVGDLVQAQEAPVWIEASRMSVWEGNPRHVLDPLKLQLLADSIAEHGQSDPIDLVADPDEPGKYLILGGQRRWKAVQMHGLQEGKLLARVRPGMPSVEVLIAAAIETQVNTDPLQDIDFAITLSRSKDLIGVKELSRVIDKSKGEISKLRQIGGLSSLLLEYMKEHAKKFTSLFAYEVVLVNEKLGEVGALEFAKTILTKNLSHKATLTVKENMMGNRQPARRSSWSIIRISMGDKQAGSMRLKESTGELAVKLKGLSVESLTSIKEAITKATESHGLKQPKD